MAKDTDTEEPKLAAATRATTEAPEPAAPELTAPEPAAPGPAAPGPAAAPAAATAAAAPAPPAIAGVADITLAGGYDPGDEETGASKKETLTGEKADQLAEENLMRKVYAAMGPVRVEERTEDIDMDSDLDGIEEEWGIE